MLWDFISRYDASDCMGRLFDIHAHYHKLPLGVDKAIVCSTSTGTVAWDELALLSSVDKRLLPSYGIHPWSVASWDTIADATQHLLRLKQYLNGSNGYLGEVGLDRSRGNFQLQCDLFALQLELAREFLLVLITIHSVRSHEMIIHYLRRTFTTSNSPTIILHAFRGNSVEVDNYLRCGLDVYFSFDIDSRERLAPKLDRAIESIPVERLLVESDAMTFESVAQKLHRSVGVLAKIKGIDASELEKIIYDNSIRVIEGVQNEPKV